MNYIGSKYSLLDFLKNTIEEVTGFKSGKGHVFGDLFAGTGIVGATFKELGYKVISNDVQYYSTVVCKHYIENSEEIETSLLDELNKLPGEEGFIYNNYCLGSGSERQYFSDENGKKCDAIRIYLEKLKKENKITDKQYYYYLASLINSIDKYANTASVYGAFLKHLKKSAAKEFKLELLPIYKNGPEGKVYNENINDVVKKEEVKGDVLYLDPPYNARQYCSNYHMLETIAKYDNPIISGKTGLREYSDQKSKYCSRRTVLEDFDDLMKNSKFKYIFLSYNNEGLMTLDEIKNIMEKYGTYKVYTTDYKRFRADNDSENRVYSADKTIEYLHCLTKKDV